MRRCLYTHFYLFQRFLTHQFILIDEYNDCFERLIEFIQWKTGGRRNSSRIDD